jgi:hypothetical protein
MSTAQLSRVVPLAGGPSSAGAFNMLLLVASVKSCGARLADDELRLEDDMPTPNAQQSKYRRKAGLQRLRRPARAAQESATRSSDPLHGLRPQPVRPPLSALDIVLTEVPAKAATSPTSGGQPSRLAAGRSFHSIDREHWSIISVYQPQNVEASA